MFSEFFAFQVPALVNFVGGGGKTALILSLAREYSSFLPVIYTTTTRIHPPPVAEGRACIASEDLDFLRVLIHRAVHIEKLRTLVVTRPSMSTDLLQGVPADFARLLDRSLCPIILNEADGARSISLKMPRAGEPVLMEGAEYLVPVIGLDCLNKPLGPETLFRWEMAAPRYSLKHGQLITPELAASILLHPEGVCKDWKEGMKIIPFINKVDSESDDALARELAGALMRNGRFPIERIVWGSVHRKREGVLL